MSLHSYNFISLLLLIVTTTAYNQPSPGCKKALPLGTTTGKSTNVSIESGHLQRSYLLHLPATYDGKSPVPLILSFHGRTKNAKQQEDLSQFSNATYNPNAIAVYPQGVMVRIGKSGLQPWFRTLTAD
jgi:poly(3-hydroxybutyrate) depolymerase